MSIFPHWYVVPTLLYFCALTCLTSLTAPYHAAFFPGTFLPLRSNVSPKTHFLTLGLLSSMSCPWGFMHSCSFSCHVYVRDAQIPLSFLFHSQWLIAPFCRTLTYLLYIKMIIAPLISHPHIHFLLNFPIIAFFPTPRPAFLVCKYPDSLNIPQFWLFLHIMGILQLYLKNKRL